MNTQIIINLKIKNVISSDCSISNINIDKIVISPKLEEDILKMIEAKKVHPRLKK